MLFLHGYLSCKESFYYQIKYFSARGYEVVAPDFPGFGASAPLVSAWSVGDYADWLSRFLSASGLERPDVVAHSFGARVAIKLASFQDVFGSLVITGGAGLVKERSAAYMRKVKAYRAVRKIAPRFAEKHFGSEEYRTLSPVMRESYKKIVNEDLSSAASSLSNRTLLIYGREDGVTPLLEEGRIFHELISSSELMSFPGGHFCFSQYPELFNSAVEKFLSPK